jgi:hypothetical protein
MFNMIWIQIENPLTLNYVKGFYLNIVFYGYFAGKISLVFSLIFV